MKILKSKFFQFLFFLLIFIHTGVFSKSLKINGLQKLSLEDIDSLTSYNIFSNDYNEIKIDNLITELYNSDLIYNIKVSELNELFTITIQESLIIENIYINGNIRIDDEILRNVLSSKTNNFLIKDNINNDVNIIRNFYSSQGFFDTTINVVTEKVNIDKVNLIFQITESNFAKISDIKFFGNSTFSNRILSSVIFSETKSNLNFFAKGSNLTREIFDIDKNRLKNYYINNGFSQVDINYSIFKNTFSTYSLDFYINENYRSKILELNFNYDEEFVNNFSRQLKIFNDALKKKISKNNNYYDYNLINDYLLSINDFLLSNNLSNKTVKVDFFEVSNDYKLTFYFEDISQKIIDKININGNSITREKTLRSKLSIEPGDYFNNYKFEKDLNSLKKLKYVNSVNSNINENDESISIDIDIIENNKTGNIMFAATANGDTGLGTSFVISDDNLFGFGNKIDSSVSVNSKSLLFDIDYQQYFNSNPNLSNRYRFFNSEKDFTNSYGYKSKETGIVYSIFYDIDDETSSSIGLNYSYNENYSPVNSSDLSISESVGDFNNFKILYSYSYDNRNDIFYPNEGILNRLFLEFSPEHLSDDPFIKINFKNSIYFKNFLTSNFFFLDNNLGIAEPLKGKLKTKETYSLGGLNFKGFDYNGIGPLNSNNIYLGGNKYFTSTFGYGSKFLFDEKDNINLKLFYTVGSLWDSDYSNIDFKLRSSAGLSFDFLTPIGPISMSYAVPIMKNDSDMSDYFNFSIGTSF